MRKRAAKRSWRGKIIQVYPAQSIFEANALLKLPHFHLLGVFPNKAGRDGCPFMCLIGCEREITLLEAFRLGKPVEEKWDDEADEATPIIFEELDEQLKRRVSLSG